MTIDELKEEFKRLSDQDKMAFMKSITPSFCAMFGKNPETMMGGMMKMMSMTGGKHE